MVAPVCTRGLSVRAYTSLSDLRLGAVMAAQTSLEIDARLRHEPDVVGDVGGDIEGTIASGAGERDWT